MITSYNEMPLSVYLRLLEVAANGPAEDSEGGDLPLLAVLSGKTEAELLTMPLPEFLDIRAKGAFLSVQPEPAGIRPRYEVGPFVCQVPSRAEDLTAGQYIDIKEWGKIEDRDNIVEVLGTILVPEGHQYNDGYSLEALREAILNTMPVTEAVALRDFFSAACAASTLAILRSSARRMPLAVRIRTAKARRQAKRGLRGLIASGPGRGGRMSYLILPALLGTIPSGDPARSSSALSATTSTRGAGRNSSGRKRSAGEGGRDD